MLFRSRHASFSLFHLFSSATLLAVLGLFACGGEGNIGDACTTRGAVDECVDGGICDADDAGDPICLEICDSQDDCSEGYECNGVSNSSTKACHPKK